MAVRTKRRGVRSTAASAATVSRAGSPGPSPTTTTRPVTYGSAAQAYVRARGRDLWCRGRHDRRPRAGLLVEVAELRVDLHRRGPHQLVEQVGERHLGRLGQRPGRRLHDRLVEGLNRAGGHHDQVEAEL